MLLPLSVMAADFQGGTVEAKWRTFSFSITEISEGVWLDDDGTGRIYDNAFIKRIENNSGDFNSAVVDWGVEASIEVIVEVTPLKKVDFVGGTVTGNWRQWNFSITEVSEGVWLDDDGSGRVYDDAFIRNIQKDSNNGGDFNSIVIDYGVEATTGEIIVAVTNEVIIDPSVLDMNLTGRKMTGYLNGNPFILLELANGSFVNAAYPVMTYTIEKVALMFGGVYGHYHTEFHEAPLTNDEQIDKDVSEYLWLQDSGVAEAWKSGWTGEGVRIAHAISDDSTESERYIPQLIVGGESDDHIGIAKDAEVIVYTYASSVLNDVTADIAHFSGSMGWINGSKIKWTEKFNTFAQESDALIIQSAGRKNNLQSAYGDNTRFVEGLMDSTAVAILVGAVDDNDVTTTNTMKANDHKDHYVVDNGGSSEGGKVTSANASARVAGKAAILMQKYPNMTAEEIKQLILETATDLGETGVDRVYGHGKVNLLKALAMED